MKELADFMRKIVRDVSRGILFEKLEYKLFQPYTIIKKTDSSILLKSRRGGALFQFPLENPADSDSSENERILTDYIYSANPTTELNIISFFRMQEGIFIDVGAFVGKYTIGVALQSPRNRVFAIEPNPISFSILKRNIMLNNVEKQVTLLNEAVSDRRCKVEFALSGSVSKIHTGSSTCKTVKVDARPLFEILARQGINPSDIRLIKIDVEGHERAILKQICEKAGELDAIKIICEMSSDEPQKESNLRQMEKSGFSVCQIDPYNCLFSK